MLPLALSGGSTNTCTGVRVCQPARTRKTEVTVVSMPAVRMLSLPSAAFVRACLRVLHNPRCQLSRHYQRRDGAARTQTVPNGAAGFVRRRQQTMAEVSRKQSLQVFLLRASPIAAGGGGLSFKTYLVQSLKSSLHGLCSRLSRHRAITSWGMSGRWAAD